MRQYFSLKKSLFFNRFIVVLLSFTPNRSNLVSYDWEMQLSLFGSCVVFFHSFWVEMNFSFKASTPTYSKFEIHGCSQLILILHRNLKNILKLYLSAAGYIFKARTFGRIFSLDRFQYTGWPQLCERFTSSLLLSLLLSISVEYFAKINPFLSKCLSLL